MLATGPRPGLGAATVHWASESDTAAFAQRLARQAAVRKAFIALHGDLGAGKTTFVRGAARALGVEGPVTSPTFTIGHRYRGRVDVSHLDLYRFAGVSAADWGDLEPYFEGAVAFVEWPEAAGEELGPVRAQVRLRHAGGNRRLVTIAPC